MPININKENIINIEIYIQISFLNSLINLNSKKI